MIFKKKKYICGKFEFQRNVIKLKESKYQNGVYNKCTNSNPVLVNAALQILTEI